VLHVQPYFTANRERTMADLTIDDLTEMMVLLDKDGNQDVCKEEFKEYCESTMGISSDAFEKMWNMIDCNGDGNLQFSELCEYFGVSVSDAEAGAKAKKQMSDEDILVMLELSTKMFEEKEKVKAAEAEKKRLTLSRRTGACARVGVTVINSSGQQLWQRARSSGSDSSSGNESDFLEACEMIEPKVDREKAMALLGWKPSADPDVIGTWETPQVSVRISGPTSEMPLHKLARNHEFQMVQRVYEIVLNDPKNGKDIAIADMNSQNKDGKTPLMIAVEGNIAYLNSIDGKADKIKKYREKQVKTVDVILSCTADMYAESTTNNWNVLHCAAHGGSYEAAQSIFKYMVQHAFTALAVRMLVNHQDKDGRTPLHVAAMRCDQASLDLPFVQLLLNKGADPLIKDLRGLTPAALAEKANRPNAKAMLDKAAEAELAQRAAYRSRSRSMSRELPTGV